nr:hypothetical protein [Tanacetum cinerariifolium]
AQRRFPSDSGFFEASHIRYALTINPTIYVSHVPQFWSTVRIETTNEGTKILATVEESTVQAFRVELSLCLQQCWLFRVKEMTAKERLSLLSLAWMQDRTGKTSLRPLPCPMTQHQGLLLLMLMRAGMSMEIGEEAGVEKSTERRSNDTEELVNVLTSMDAANILTSGIQAVSVPPVL